ncbi:glycosylphosphatidylinositol-anchored protein quiver [Dermatophagoides farinae]|uniref:glycosylphosphatidylinositol-anchored protein quiver n=1 Tax=Dermatophagoides farinae TaxID=6954 RepID=UPI003F646A10
MAEMEKIWPFINSSSSSSSLSSFIVDKKLCTLINLWWWWWRWCWLLIKRKLSSTLTTIYGHHNNRLQSFNITANATIYHHLPNANVLFPVLFILIISIFIPMANCEEECLRSKVWCYECESINDPYCNDPFNVSFDMSLMKMCEGCCVKIVLEKNTPQKNIWRTCTSRLQINLFMVDHVCMEESGGQGHMCFCESDGCNDSRSIHHHNYYGHSTNSWITIISTISIIFIIAVINETITSFLITSSSSSSSLLLLLLLAIDHWLPSLSSPSSSLSIKFPLKFLHILLLLLMIPLILLLLILLFLNRNIIDLNNFRYHFIVDEIL